MFYSKFLFNTENLINIDDKNHFIDLKTSLDTDGDGFSDDVENSLGTDPYDKWSYPKPDLNVSSWQYSNNVITIEVMNEGICNATGVVLHVQIPSLGLMIYNNSETPFFLDVDDGMEIQIDLSKYDPYLVKGKAYKIDIYLDPDDLINETNEITNNFSEISITYTNSSGSNPNYFYIFFIVLILGSVSTIVGGTTYHYRYIFKKEYNGEKSKKKFGSLNKSKKSLIQDPQKYPKLPKSSSDNSLIKTPEVKKSKLDILPIKVEELDDSLLEESEIGVETIQYTCIVHQGPIIGTSFVCPHCKTMYCYKCAKTLKIKNEKCLTCNKDIDIKVSEIERFEFLNKNSLNIAQDLLDSYPIIKNYIESTKSADKIPEIRNYEFSVLNAEEYEKLDILSLSPEEKRQFFEEIIWLSPEERNELLDEMIDNEYRNHTSMTSENEDLI